jgi:hypothetical protein
VIDTIRLVVAPTVVGAGRRLFEHPSATAGLRLVGHEVWATGVALLEYDTAGAARTAEYEGVSTLVR